MRRLNISFAIAIAASIAAHLLLFDTARHIHLSLGGPDSGMRRPTRITLLLNDDAAPINAPAVDDEPPDEIGDSAGTGTATHDAKGDAPLIAPKADQDQPFLSRDPIGAGHVGDLPADWTGPRGQNGTGGQRGSASAAPRPDAPTNAPEPAAEPTPSEAPEAHSTDPRPPKPMEALPPQSLAEQRPTDVSPPPAKDVGVGAAQRRETEAPSQTASAAAPVETKPLSDAGPIVAAPRETPTVAPQPANSTAPPTPNAPDERPSVVPAPQVAMVTAPLAPPSPPKANVSAQVVKPNPAPDPARPKPSAPAPQAQVRIATGDALAPGPNRSQADPAQESDSESDPFSKISVVDVMHDGRLEVRRGRKVKTTRPHLGLAAEVELLTVQNPTVVLKISIDATGKVTSADVVESGGSIGLDQACRVAVYDWWFEPSHDKKGRPIPDVILFSIRFHS